MLTRNREKGKGNGDYGAGGAAIFQRMIRQGLSDRVTLEERPDEGEKLDPRIFRGKEFQREGTQVPIEVVK